MKRRPALLSGTSSDAMALAGGHDAREAQKRAEKGLGSTRRDTIVKALTDGRD